MQELNQEKQWIKDFEAAKTQVEDAETLYEFFKEGEVEESELIKKHDHALSLIEELEFKKYAF